LRLASKLARKFGTGPGARGGGRPRSSVHDGAQLVRGAAINHPPPQDVLCRRGRRRARRCPCDLGNLARPNPRHHGEHQDLWGGGKPTSLLGKFDRGGSGRRGSDTPEILMLSKTASPGLSLNPKAQASLDVLLVLVETKAFRDLAEQRGWPVSRHSRGGRPSDVKTYASGGRFGQCSQEFAKIPRLHSTTGTNRPFMACNYCVQYADPHVYVFETSYCTPQTGGLTGIVHNTNTMAGY
jgi:hypothetical protein